MRSVGSLYLVSLFLRLASPVLSDPLLHKPVVIRALHLCLPSFIASVACCGCGERPSCSEHSSATLHHVTGVDTGAYTNLWLWF